MQQLPAQLVLGRLRIPYQTRGGRWKVEVGHHLDVRYGFVLGWTGSQLVLVSMQENGIVIQ
jgi:hypothetical protein